MHKWILLLALAMVPAAAQRARVDNMKSFRQDLAAAVSNGSLNAEEKAKYEGALKTIDAQRAARKSGDKSGDRQANRQALQDLAAIAKSPNLKEEDRTKLAKHFDGAARGKKRK